MTVNEISLANLLKEKYILLSIKEESKSKIIAELASLVGAGENKKEEKRFLKLLMEREKLGSTAIGGGIAIPHAKVDGLKKPILIFGRSIAGVDFSSLDGEKTYLFFMLISPKQEIGTHLKILARVSHLTKDKFAVERLKKAQNKKEVISFLSFLEKG